MLSYKYQYLRHWSCIFDPTRLRTRTAKVLCNITFISGYISCEIEACPAPRYVINVREVSVVVDEIAPQR
jgi:hypothetical protein